MTKKYSSIQQHEPLRVPTGWGDQEKRFIVQLEEILDDLYRRFNRIKLSDLGSELKTTVLSASDGVKQHELMISATNEMLFILATDQESTQTQVTQTAQQLQAVAQNQEGLQTTVTQTAQQLQTVVSDQRSLQTKFEQTTESFTFMIEEVVELAENPKKLQNTYVKIDTKGINMTGGEINVTAGASVKIKAGGTFELESENFNVTPEGRVSMIDAVVSGNLSQNGFGVLTQEHLIISSTEPVSKPNRVWVKPVAVTAITYLYNIPRQEGFENYVTQHSLTAQSVPVAAQAEQYTYTLRIPYTVVGTVNYERTITVMLVGENGATVSMTGALSSVNGFTGVIELQATTAAWLGESANIKFTITLDCPPASNVYMYHKITPGAVQLICTAKTGNASGWASAEVYVFQ